MHTTKKTPRPKPPPRPRPHNCWPLSAACCPAARSGDLASLQKGRFYDRFFTPLVTLWYLIFQRLAADHTLEKVVTDAQAGGANALRPGLSAKNCVPPPPFLSAMPASVCRWLFCGKAWPCKPGACLALNPHTLWHNLIVCLLDGSTVRLRPYGDIPRRFPPNGNQARSAPYWCLMRVVVGFCARSGAALACAHGSFFRSEQLLACRMMLRSALGACLYVGDRNFGVFRIVQTARAVGGHVLLRLTEARARRLLGRRLRLGSHPVLWSRTASDRLQPGCSQALRLRTAAGRRPPAQRLSLSNLLLVHFPDRPRGISGGRTGRTLRSALAHRIELALPQNPNASGPTGMQIRPDGPAKNGWPV